MAYLPKCGAIIVFGVLKEVFRLDLIARPGTLTREPQIQLIAAYQTIGSRVGCGGDDSAVAFAG